MRWPLPRMRAAELVSDECAKTHQENATLRKRVDRLNDDLSQTRAALARANNERDSLRKEAQRLQAIVDEKHDPIRPAPIAPICASECKADANHGACVIAGLRHREQQLTADLERRR